MKKMFFVITVSLVMLFILCVCGGTAEPQTGGDPFVYIQNKAISAYNIVYDRETLVMYAISNGTHNMGTFTVLLNSDGTPKLYQPELY